MVRSLKILIEYILSVARVFMVFLVALFLPWAFLYQVQTYVADGKTSMRIVHNDRGKDRANSLNDEESAKKGMPARS